MASIHAAAEAALIARQSWAGQDSPLIKPSYDGLGLVNIPSLGLQLLGVEERGAAAPALNPALLQDAAVTARFNDFLARGPINHVIVLLVDALGYDQLLSDTAAPHTPNLRNAAENDRNFFMPVTSVFPSTTATALTSLNTAHTPQQHGIMATTTYLPNIGTIGSLLFFKPEFDRDLPMFSENVLDPDNFVPVPSLTKRLNDHKLTSNQVNYHAFKDSPLSRFGRTGGQPEYTGYYTPAGCIAALRNLVEHMPSSGQKKSYTYAYIPTIDTTAHKYGPLSSHYQAELAAIDFSFAHELTERVRNRPDVLFVITADHGQVSIDTEKVVWLNEHPEFTRLLSAPAGGERRATYLYLKNGEGVLEKAKNYAQAHFSGSHIVLTKAEALEQGLFGLSGETLADECADRIGDLILIPRTDWILCYPTTKTHGYPGSTGVHGGLSRAEMLVPFLAMRLG